MNFEHQQSDMTLHRVPPHALYMCSKRRWLCSPRAPEASHSVCCCPAQHRFPCDCYCRVTKCGYLPHPGPGYCQAVLLLPPGCTLTSACSQVERSETCISEYFKKNWILVPWHHGGCPGGGTFWTLASTKCPTQAGEGTTVNIQLFNHSATGIVIRRLLRQQVKTLHRVELKNVTTALSILFALHIP
jgi:hypothetical protein